MKNEGVKLTPKQKLFLKLYLDPESKTFGNGTKSALIAYDTEDYSTAGQLAYGILKKHQITTKQLMEKKGLGLGRLLDTMDDGLKADRIISAISGKQSTGTDTDFIEVPDHAVRHKYLETAGKWLGMDKKESTIGVRTDGETIEVIVRDY